MKNIIGFFTVLLVIALGTLSCQEDTPELEKPLAASKIDLEVSQDLSIDAGGNTAIFSNNTPGVIPIWDYGTGRSTRQIDTVRYAFMGTYSVKRSAMTAGGLVELPDATIEVTQNNFSYVNDPLWTLLSGGVGNEKTWVLDFDANGVSKHFDGYVYFSGIDYGWNNECTKEGGDCWFWGPGWQNWMPGPADYGSMTFNLKGGPFIHVEQKAIEKSGVYDGTYFLDTSTKTISFTDAIPINNGYDQIYSKAYIVSLTENTMQLGFRASAKSENEIFNYILKE